jgi:hypothetical protein
MLPWSVACEANWLGKEQSIPMHDHLKQHWATIKHQLLEGTFEPHPVRRVKIPKPGGGKRLLGIPTVLDQCNHSGTRCLPKRVAAVLWDYAGKDHDETVRLMDQEASALLSMEAVGAVGLQAFMYSWREPGSCLEHVQISP